MKIKAERILLFALLLIVASCSNMDKLDHKDKVSSSSQKWKSNFHSFKAEYDSPWELIPSLSTKEKTVFGLIDKSDGKSYIVKITNDVSKDVLSDADYYEASKELMLNANNQNTLVDERDVKFHDEYFHRQVFVMHTDKWGVLLQHAFTRRTGELAYSVQISYPLKEGDSEKLELPKLITELDQNIRIGNEYKA